MIYPQQQCDKCKHRIYEKPGQFCRAFPEGIPEKYAYGNEKHDKVDSEQKGSFVFEISQDL